MSKVKSIFKESHGNNLCIQCAHRVEDAAKLTRDQSVNVSKQSESKAVKLDGGFKSEEEIIYTLTVVTISHHYYVTLDESC